LSYVLGRGRPPRKETALTRLSLLRRPDRALTRPMGLSLLLLKTTAARASAGLPHYDGRTGERACLR